MLKKLTLRQFNKRYQDRPLSFSQLSSFEYSPAQWYQSYWLGIRSPATPAMVFGSVVGDSIGTPQSLVPTLTPPGVKEYEMRASIDDIHMVGFADHFCDTSLVLHENKTTDNPKKWNQTSVNKHHQLTMYALLLWLEKGIAPEAIKMQLNCIPVIVGNDFIYRLPDPPSYKSYSTTRTTLQVVEYVNFIKRINKEMYEYVRSHSK